jgi:hypothetical protein
MALNFSTTDLANARSQEREIEALPDREYIQTVCNVIVQALKNPATENLDLSGIRQLVKEFSDQLEDKIYAQADRLGTASETPAEDLSLDDELENLDNEDFRTESTLSDSDKVVLESITLLKKAGYNVNG